MNSGLMELSLGVSKVFAGQTDADVHFIGVGVFVGADTERVRFILTDVCDSGQYQLFAIRSAELEQNFRIAFGFPAGDRH